MALPEIRLLQTAIAVARELNFSRAAESLHIGQSTLSKQIYELESQLGFKLFERNHQNVDPADLRTEMRYFASCLYRSSFSPVQRNTSLHRWRLR